MSRAKPAPRESKVQPPTVTTLRSKERAIGLPVNCKGLGSLFRPGAKGAVECLGFMEISGRQLSRRVSGRKRNARRIPGRRDQGSGGLVPPNRQRTAPDPEGENRPPRGGLALAGTVEAPSGVAEMWCVAQGQSLGQGEDITGPACTRLPTRLWRLCWPNHLPVRKCRASLPHPDLPDVALAQRSLLLCPHQ